MANLFDLNKNEFEILKMLENEELSFEDAKDTLDSIEDEKHRKYDFMQKMILSLKGNVNTLKEREQTLNKRRKSYENKIKSMQNYMLDAMKFKGEEKFKTEEFTYFIRKTKSTDIIDEKEVPEQYKIPQLPKIDRQKIKDDIIKNSLEVPGARIAENESLVVR